VAPEGEVCFPVMNRGSRVGGIVPGGSAALGVELHVGRDILEAAPEEGGPTRRRAPN